MQETIVKPQEKCPVYVNRSVVEQIKRYGREHREREVCGVLLGNLCWTPEGTWIVSIDAFVKGKNATSSAGSVTYTDETWNYIHTILDRDYPHKIIVGWFHTHPTFGIFLSPDDLTVCSATFNQPWQAAYVYDPVQEEDGWFLWDRSLDEPTRASVVVVEDAIVASGGPRRPVATPAPAVSQTFRERKETPMPIARPESSFPMRFLIAALAFTFSAATIFVVCWLVFQNSELRRQVADLDARTTKFSETLEADAVASRSRLDQNADAAGTALRNVETLKTKVEQIEALNLSAKIGEFDALKKDFETFRKEQKAKFADYPPTYEEHKKKEFASIKDAFFTFSFAAKQLEKDALTKPAPEKTPDASKTEEKEKTNDEKAPGLDPNVKKYAKQIEANNAFGVDNLRKLFKLSGENPNDVKELAKAAQEPPQTADEEPQAKPAEEKKEAEPAEPSKEKEN